MRKVTARLNNVRISPRKVNLVAGDLRGKQVQDALDILKFDLRKPSEIFIKLINSAIANATNNFQIKESGLIISEIMVGEGPTLKRWMPRAHGRASKILKRTSRITLVLTEQEDSNDKSDKVVKEDNSINK